MSQLSAPVIAMLVVGSAAAVLAVIVTLGWLITRRRPGPAPAEATKTDDPTSPWPQTSLQRVKEETARRPPLSGPEI